MFKKITSRRLFNYDIVPINNPEVNPFLTPDVYKLGRGNCNPVRYQMTIDNDDTARNDLFKQFQNPINIEPDSTAGNLAPAAYPLTPNPAPATPAVENEGVWLACVIDTPSSIQYKMAHINLTTKNGDKVRMTLSVMPVGVPDPHAHAITEEVSRTELQRALENPDKEIRMKLTDDKELKLNPDDEVNTVVYFNDEDKTEMLGILDKTLQEEITKLKAENAELREKNDRLKRMSDN